MVGGSLYIWAVQSANVTPVWCQLDRNLIQEWNLLPSTAPMHLKHETKECDPVLADQIVRLALCILMQFCFI